MSFTRHIMDYPYQVQVKMTYAEYVSQINIRSLPSLMSVVLLMSKYVNNCETN